MVEEIPVLLIEENKDLRESIISNLGSDGFKVYTATDGPSGIKTASKYSARLILLDVMDGLKQIVSALKHNPSTEHIPVIILTESDSISGAERASEIEADGHITKPFSDEQLAEIVKLKLENCEAVMEETQHLKRIPILVIEDEDDIRKLIKYSLYAEGFEVYTAEDGPAGIKAARKHKPRLILLDVMMPGMDGLEVLFNLKWNKKTKDIPVFMLTARKTLGDMERAFARRAEGYFTKPFDSKKLGKIIKEKLREYENRQEK